MNHYKYITNHHLRGKATAKQVTASLIIAVLTVDGFKMKAFTVYLQGPVC